MKRFLLFALASLTGLIVVPQDRVEPLVPAPTQQQQESSQFNQENKVEKSLDEKRIDAEIETILEIRRQLGGGVAETLGRDFSLELTPDGITQDQAPATVRVQKLDDTFQKQLTKQLREQQQNRLQQIRQAPQPDQFPEVYGPQPSPEMQISRLLRNDMPSPQERDPAEVERRQQIREAARMLEQAAAILEEAREYRQADSVRSSASKLWQSAR